MVTIQNNSVVNTKDNKLYQDTCYIIEQAQETAYHAVNETLIKRNWLLGMRINIEVLQSRRAEYGEQIISTLSKSLKQKYGEGFTKTNIYNYISFYKTWPEFFHAVSGESGKIFEEYILHALGGKNENIVNVLCSQTPIRLSWTHYRIILQENKQEARDWYVHEAAREMWGTRTLQRNVSSQYWICMSECMMRL